MDYNNGHIYTDSLVIISLECIWERTQVLSVPKYIKQNFEENQIMPNVVSSFYKHKASSRASNDLLSKMIDSGKELYFRMCCSQTIAMLIRWDIQRAVRMVY
jgi:hypothetical protein